MIAQILQAGQSKFLIAACPLVLSVGVLSAETLGDAQPQRSEKTKTIRWAVVHTANEPPYSELMERWARGVAKKSGGELAIKFIENKDEGKDSAEGEFAVHQRVLDGAVDVAQLEITVARYAPALVSPFVFRSYAHAEAVFASPIGKKLLDSAHASTKGQIRALAFTYSGGYRNMFGNFPIRQLNDFKNSRMFGDDDSGSPGLTGDLMQELGVRLVKKDDNGTDDLDRVDLREGLVNRAPYAPPEMLKQVRFVTLTRHRMLVTSIVANEKFLSGLSGKQRRMIIEEVEALAVAERQLSVNLEKGSLEFLLKKGVQVFELPAAERQRFADAAKVVEKKRPDLSETLQEIRAVNEIRTPVTKVKGYGSISSAIGL